MTTPLRVPSADFVRDAEKKHGRVAMLAIASLAALSTVDADPVSWLSRQPVDAQLAFFSLSGVAEAASTFPRLGPRYSLREGVHPGNFAPFPLGPPGVDALEDAVGRAAMLVAAGVLVAHGV